MNGPTGERAADRGIVVSLGKKLGTTGQVSEGTKLGIIICHVFFGGRGAHDGPPRGRRRGGPDVLATPDFDSHHSLPADHSERHRQNGR